MDALGLASLEPQTKTWVPHTVHAWQIKMMRKPLTKSETDDLNSVLERAAQRMERRKANGTVTEVEVEQLAHAIADCEMAAQKEACDVERRRVAERKRRLPVHPQTWPDHVAEEAEEAEALKGVLAALRDEPREA